LLLNRKQLIYCILKAIGAIFQYGLLLSLISNIVLDNVETFFERSLSPDKLSIDIVCLHFGKVWPAQRAYIFGQKTKQPKQQYAKNQAQKDNAVKVFKNSRRYI